MLSCFWQSIKHNLQYDRVCKSFRSLFFLAYSRGVKAKWLYSPNVTTLREYLLRNLKSLILCYYFMRMLFVRDFSKCWSLVERLKLGASRLRGWSSVLRDSLIHFISIYKVRDILRVESLWLQRFIFTLFLVDKVKDILRVEARWLRDSLHSYGSIFCDRPPPKGDQFFFRGCWRGKEWPSLSERAICLAFEYLWTSYKPDEDAGNLS